MKRKCLNCSHCFTDRYGDPVSCDYGLTDGAMHIGDICPKDLRKIRNFRENNMKDIPDAGCASNVTQWHKIHNNLEQKGGEIC